MTFLFEAYAALFPFAETWSPSATLLIGNCILTAVSSFVVTGLFRRDNRILTGVTVVMLFAAGLYSNGMSREVVLPDTGPFQRGIVLAIPGQLVMAYLLFLIFGYRPSGDNRP